MKQCYVKCASNEQAQALRPYLVQEGFEDDVVWNDIQIANNKNCINFWYDNSFDICNLVSATDNDEPLLYTVHADADLAEAAKTIKTLFDKL